jgi:hypothetical protein
MTNEECELAIEAAEGTDCMLARSPKRAPCRGLGPGRIGQGGKARPRSAARFAFDRPAEDRRRSAGRTGGDRGIAGSTIVAEPERIGATADRARLFVLGVREQAAER